MANSKSMLIFNSFALYHSDWNKCMSLATEKKQQNCYTETLVTNWYY